MRAVIYTHAMEPITVVTLNKFALECLDNYKAFRMPFCSLPDLASYVPSGNVPIAQPVFAVTLTAQPFWHHGVKGMLLFTYQEEDAMLLRSAFLPGQMNALTEEKARACAQGFLFALQHFGE